MISKKYYYQIITRATLIVLASFATAACWFHYQSFLLTIMGFSITMVALIKLVAFLNTTNRLLLTFFDAVHNNDSTLIIPTTRKHALMIDLNQHMTRLNGTIQQLKIESRRQEQYFQTLIEHAATGLLAFNSKGFVMHANTAAKRLLMIVVLTHVRQLDRVNTKLYQTVTNIKPLMQSVVNIPSERGTLQLLIKATTFKSGEEELTVLAIQDIGNQMDEQELDAWLKLIRVMMHEMMNSIAPITSLSESLASIYVKDGQLIEPSQLPTHSIQTTVRGLNVISQQGNGLKQFVESYRNLMHLPKPDKKLFKVAELLSRVEILYHSLYSTQNARMAVACHPADMELYADENQISQILVNLVKNALQANEEHPGLVISIKGRINSGKAEIAVTDNGVGITPEIMTEIFVPFFTTRANGSGIGLSVSRQIMRLHGGKLIVHSQPNRETVFTLQFNQ